MAASHLLSFYGSNDPNDGYAPRQRSLHESASKVGQIDQQHPWDMDKLRQTDFYQQHKEVLDQQRGAGFWLWKPYLILKILDQIGPGEWVMYHDVGRAINRDTNIGYQFSRPIQPLIDWAEIHNGMFPGIYIPVYGPNRKWTKRDCFVLMDCDHQKYWDHSLIQAGINIWKNTAEVRDFLTEWLEYCKDPRILTDQDNQCGKDNLPEFEDHRHDQSILTNLVIKKGVTVYGKPDQGFFKQRNVGYITTRVVVDRLLRESPGGLEKIAERHQSDRIQRGYIPFYQLHMEEQRLQPIQILEVRSQPNNSISMWSDYLPNADIHALYPGARASDVNGTDTEKIRFHSVEPSHRPSLELFCQRAQKAGTQFDIIIEAGSGLMRDQQLAIGVLFRLLKPGGQFIIENMENSLITTGGDVNHKLKNSTLDLIRRINLPTLNINSHFFSLETARFFASEADSAGVEWTPLPEYGIGIIQRKG